MLGLQVCTTMFHSVFFFFFLFSEMESHYVIQASLKLLGSSSPLTLASPVFGIWDYRCVPSWLALVTFRMGTGHQITNAWWEMWGLALLSNLWGREGAEGWVDHNGQLLHHVCMMRSPQKLKRIRTGQMWWCMPIIPALETQKQKQEDC
jgi:hypothetical protein